MQQKRKHTPEDRLMADGDEVAEKPKHKPEHRLEETIGFTEEDLVANREGKMSTAQYDKLRKELRTGVFAAAALVVMGVVAFFWLTLAGPEVCAPALVVGAIPTLVAMFLSIRLGQKNRDRVLRQVRSVEGRVQLDVTSSGQSSTLTIRVEGAKFRVNKATFLAFKNGDPYVIYYTPASKTILSAEWLREE